MKPSIMTTQHHLETSLAVTVATEVSLYQQCAQPAPTAQCTQNMRHTICVHLAPTATTQDYQHLHSVRRVSRECTVQEKVYTTVLPAKSDSDFTFCLQSYQGLVIDRLLVY